MSAICRESSVALGSSFPQTVAILAGQTTSSPFRVDQWAEGGIVLPASFSGGTISFLVSTDAGGPSNAAGTFVALYDKTNTLVSLTVTQNRAYALPADIFGFSQVKLVSGSAETPGRTIGVFGKG